MRQIESVSGFHVLEASRGRADAVALGPEHGPARLQRFHHRLDTPGSCADAEERWYSPGLREQVAPRLRAQSLAGEMLVLRRR